MNEYVSPSAQFVDLPPVFPMARGGVVRRGRIAYEMWGRPNRAGDNVVLLLPGLSAGTHAASRADDPAAGWWEDIVGPRKPLDTDRWCVVCVNPLGSCKGSTGPASPDPSTGKPYRLTFPDLTVEDIADAAALSMHALGVERLACVIGLSMGGMSALALISRHPGLARNHVNISGAAHSLPFSIALRSFQREAIMRDPLWKGGDYDSASGPVSGMTLARKLGMITYRSSREWDVRFGRRRLKPPVDGDRGSFGSEFEIEGYLEENARKFARAYDPNSFLYLSRSMDRFDLGDGFMGDADRALSNVDLEQALVIGVETDMLFPIVQQNRIAAGLRAGGVETAFFALDCPQGHDAFLIDHRRFGRLIRGFMDRLGERAGRRAIDRRPRTADVPADAARVEATDAV